MPKLYLLYFKNILDLAFCRFFDEFNDRFSKMDETYVLSKTLSDAIIRKRFVSYISEEICSFVSEFDMMEPKYYFIIGSCLPKDNILLKYRDDKYFPKKILDVVENRPNLKYVLNEKDIKLDISRFNEIIIGIFNDMFTSRKKLTKILGHGCRNVFFIQHRVLDCYAMFKIIKRTFGSSNCVNMFTERFSGIHMPIVAVNELILKYIKNKKEILRTDEFSSVSGEISEYIRSCMDSCME